MARKLQDFTTQNLMNSPVIQEKMARYENRRSALAFGYKAAFERYDQGKPMDFMYRMSHEIAAQYEKDLNDAMNILEQDNGSESKTASISHPAPIHTK